MVGGLFATIVMTIVMMAAGDGSPPPTAALWSKYVGDAEPGEYMMQGMALHLLYGVAAGAVFAAALPVAGIQAAAAPITAVAAGAAYGFALFLLGAVFWMKLVLGMDPEKKQVLQFLVLHLVYGVVLGGTLAVAPI